RYHALTPDTFWWTHVTFFEVILDFNERFAYKKFTQEQKDQLVREAVTWWRCYGLTDRPAFDDYASFRTYWEDMLDNHLINTHTTKWSTRIAEHDIAPAPKVPTWLWRLTSRPTMAVANWIGKALMPEKARETLEWEWTPRDERMYFWFARFLTLTDRFWHLLPLRLRYAPRAYSGIRAQGL
ncbi:MAG: oxygenase MpaB family protein, partial [Rhodococcus sp. (in: high G+C Gram-positive bacteria)]